MKPAFLYLPALAAALALTAPAAHAQTAPAAPGKTASVRRPPVLPIATEMTKTLSLTDDQQRKISDLLMARYRVSDMGPSAEFLSGQDAKIRALLTPEQRGKYDAQFSAKVKSNRY